MIESWREDAEYYGYEFDENNPQFKFTEREEKEYEVAETVIEKFNTLRNKLNSFKKTTFQEIDIRTGKSYMYLSTFYRKVVFLLRNNICSFCNGFSQTIILDQYYAKIVVVSQRVVESAKNYCYQYFQYANDTFDEVITLLEENLGFIEEADRQNTQSFKKIKKKVH